jgi:hypothetical protein
MVAHDDLRTVRPAHAMDGQWADLVAVPVPRLCLD